MQTIKIGKSDTNNIYKDFKNDLTVSRVHCEIFVDDQGNKFLTDLKSTNGTFVNGDRVVEPVLLTRYDIVRAGNSLVKWKEYFFKYNKDTINSTAENFDNNSKKIKTSKVKSVELMYVDGKFNNKNPKYKHIKITNIILLVLFMLADMYAAAVDSARFSPLASLITFWIARAIIRNIFIKNSDFNYKIITTVGVYIGTFIIKTVILIYILNLIL